MVERLKLAAATEDFGGSLRAAIHAAADCGVSGVRLNARHEVRADQFTETALRQLRLLIAERQMDVAGLYFPSSRSLYDQQNLDRRLESIRAAMRQMRKLNTKELLVRCGRIPDPDSGANSERKVRTPVNSDIDSLVNPFSFAPSLTGSQGGAAVTESQQFSMLVEILDDLARFGNHVGCVLQLQLATYDIARAERLLDTVKGGPVQLVFDPATAVMTGTSPGAVFRSLYQHFGYVRARDAIKDVDGAGIETTVGEGVVDWTEMLPIFGEADFRGWVCVERTGGDQRAADVRLGISRICNLLSQF